MDNTEFASKLGFLFNGVGIVGSIFFCLIIMHLQVTIQTEIILRNACILSITITLTCFVFFAQSVMSKDAQHTAIFTSLVGFFSMPVMFISYELLVSLTPTIGEAMSCGVLNSIANISCFVALTALTPVLQIQSKLYTDAVMAFMALILIISLALIWQVKIDRKDYNNF